MRDGRHINGFKHRNRRTNFTDVNRNQGRNSLIGTIISAFAGLIIKDISSPNSRIKTLTNNIFKSKKIEAKKEKTKIIKPEFEVIENKKEVEK